MIRLTNLSRESVAHLARRVTDELRRAESAHFLRDSDAIRQSIMHTIYDEAKLEAELIRTVHERIARSESVPAEGTREWEEVFDRFFAEARADFHAE